MYNKKHFTNKLGVNPRDTDYIGDQLENKTKNDEQHGPHLKLGRAELTGHK